MITQKVLIQQLRAMGGARPRHPRGRGEPGGRVDYSLTTLGAALVPLIRDSLHARPTGARRRRWRPSRGRAAGQVARRRRQITDWPLHRGFLEPPQCRPYDDAR